MRTSTPESVVLVWTGDVDLNAVETLRAQLHDAVDQGFEHLTIDLAAVRFLDSLGVGLLLEARLAAIRAGGKLVLRGVPVRHRSLLRSVGVGNLFTFVPAAAAEQAEQAEQAEHAAQAGS